MGAGSGPRRLPGPYALELELGVVALAERAVAVARHQMADLGQSRVGMTMALGWLAGEETMRRRLYTASNAE